MDNNKNTYICVTNGFRIKRIDKDNHESKKKVEVRHGDIVEEDSDGYLVKDDLRFCHKESILA